MQPHCRGSPVRQNLGRLLSQRAQRTPDLEALVEVESGRRLSWSELDARANRTAQTLIALGVGPGDRVALLLMNGSEIFESYMAIAKLGGIAVPLNWRLVPDELSFLLRDCGAIGLIYGDDFDDNVAEIARRGSAGSGVGSWLRVGREAERPDFALSYDAAQESASSAAPEMLAGGDDDLLILYTSGTTGRPKGAVHTHNTALWGGTGFNLSLDMRYRDAWLLFMPAFHVGALNPFVSCMQRGMTCVVMRAFEADAAWQVIERERITNFIAVPAMLNAMLPAVERGEVDASSVRWILTGGAPVPVPLLEAYARHDIGILGGYGLTEACGLGCL
jgi:acyl-CoA synthetase (AMP-forming)/AMP-acid ligase II